MLSIKSYSDCLKWASNISTNITWNMNTIPTQIRVCKTQIRYLRLIRKNNFFFLNGFFIMSYFNPPKNRLIFWYLLNNKILSDGKRTCWINKKIGNSYLLRELLFFLIFSIKVKKWIKLYSRNVNKTS